MIYEIIHSALKLGLKYVNIDLENNRHQEENDFDDWCVDVTRKKRTKIESDKKSIEKALMMIEQDKPEKIAVESISFSKRDFTECVVINTPDKGTLILFEDELMKLIGQTDFEIKKFKSQTIKYLKIKN